MTAETFPQTLFRDLGPGSAMVWALPPEPGQKNPGAFRSRALARGAAPLGDGATAAGPWREVTVLEGWRAPVAGLAALLQRLGALAGAPLLRLEWPLAEAAALATFPLPGPGAPPLFLQFTTSDLALPDSGGAPAIARLADAGLPLGAEVWLERGVNDRAAALREWLLAMLRHRVRPQALVGGAWLPPPRRVEPEAALELLRNLRGWISGLAVPQLVREGKDGSRVVLIPDYLRAVEGERAEGVTYRGEGFVYDPGGRGPGG